VYGQQQIMNHMVSVYPFTKFGGWLQSLHEASDDSIHWLEFTAAKALAKLKKIPAAKFYRIIFLRYSAMMQVLQPTDDVILFCLQLFISST